MKNWIENEVVLQGRSVGLHPLHPGHLPDLERVAKDKRIWEFYTFDGSQPEILNRVYQSALADRDLGHQFPFIIWHNNDQQIIGSTRFLDLQPAHKKLEIGGTWLHPDYWATEVNLECKLLLLTYCFENLQALRVQLKTDENNWRSRKAIEKIGGRFEGILRNDMLRADGSKRNSAYFSITDDEWTDRKADLIKLYRSKIAF